MRPGRALVAPGGHQLRVMRQGEGYVYVVRVQERTRRIGVVLTGMGKDGAAGLAMRRAGARTFAQDKASSIVFGIPAEAARLGAAEKMVAARDLPGQLALVAYT